MPIVNVAMLKGRSPEYKKTVLDCIHQGLVDAIGIEDWDRFQRIIEYDKADFEFERTEEGSYREHHGFPEGKTFGRSFGCFYCDSGATT